MMIAQWKVRIFEEILIILGFQCGRELTAKRSLGSLLVFPVGRRLRDEPSISQPNASVDLGDQWWDLCQNPVSARTPNLIDGDKVAFVVPITQIRLPMSAHLSGVQAARNTEPRVDSDLERVRPGWLQILPGCTKNSPAASGSCP
jgi:hypothetical protein